MHSLINTNFNRTYNPHGRQNVLSDIKRLLTSRDTESQSRACVYLIEAINKYNFNSNERIRVIEYLLDNDIVVFLCEATSNLDFSLFRSILQCIGLLWRIKRFYDEEHSTHALSAIIRCLVHYSAIDTINAVETCLHFICHLLIGIREYEATSPLSHQSAYNTEQLLGAFKNLSSHIKNKPNTILCSTFVLHELISYQPASLDIRGNIAVVLAEVLDKWLEMLGNTMSRVILVGENGDVGSMMHVTCQLGINVLRLTNIIEKPKTPSGLVQKIITDQQEITTLKEAASKMKSSIHKLIKELVILTKDHQNVLASGEYGIFLRFLFNFMNENAKAEIMTDFCDYLFSNGYLIILPQTQIIRDDPAVRKLSSLVLGEMLKTLTAKYLYVEGSDLNAICSKDIDMDLVDIQYGIEKKQNIDMLLKKNQPYSFLIYTYFYCQSSENPEESTSFLLPYLVDYLLTIPKNVRLPGHIIKALWLVFAMSSISNGTLQSLQQRVYLEKAIDRLVSLLNPEPSKYYTHNPVILFWSFTSLRISNLLKLQVLSEWFKNENNLPNELTKEPIIWELLLNIIIQSKDITVVTNCIETLKNCVKDAEENSRNDFSLLIWSLLPSVLSNALIDNDDNLANTNITHLLDIAIEQFPLELEQMICIKIAVLITTLYSKNTPHSDTECRNHFEFVCLEVCLLLLEISKNFDDNKVLLTYIYRVDFLPCVLTATNNSDDRVACAALKLLSQVVYYFAKYKYNINMKLNQKIGNGKGKYQYIIICCILIQFGVCLADYFINISSFGNIYLQIWTYLSIPLILYNNTESIVIFQISCFTNTVLSTLVAINNKLENLRKEQRSLCQFYNPLVPKLAWSNRKLDFITSRKQQYADIFQREEKKKVNFLQSLRELGIHYSVICDIVRDTMQIDGILLCLLILYFFLLFQFNFFIVLFWKIFTKISLFYNITVTLAFIWVFIHGTCLVIFVEPFQRIFNAMQRTKVLVNSLKAAVIDDESKKNEVEIFQRMLLLNDVTFSPLYMLTINRSLILKILGGVLTYVVTCLTYGPEMKMPNFYLSHFYFKNTTTTF